MKEFMYDINSALIAALLFISMLLLIEVGYRVGRKYKSNTNEPSKAHISAIQGSLLGVLALILGFTFSLSLQRYDSRSSEVVNEANTIGTTFLRAQLLPAAIAAPAQSLLTDYVKLRVESGKVTLVDQDEREQLLAESKTLQNKLWALAVQSAQQDAGPVKSGLFIQSLNDMIDALESRNAALDKHVPEVVLLLLYGTFLMTGSIVGFSAGLAGHRTSFVTYIMVGLIVLLVFVIVDLDRPRRGFIEVSQKSLITLSEEINQNKSHKNENALLIKK